jgi:hypothetical protein
VQGISCMKNIQLNSLVTCELWLVVSLLYVLYELPTIQTTQTSSCVLCTLVTTWEESLHSSTGHWGSNLQIDDWTSHVYYVHKNPLLCALVHLGALSKKCRASAVKHLFWW